MKSLSLAKKTKIFLESSLHGNFNSFLTTGFRQLVGFLLGIFTSIVVAKTLGPEGNGLYITFTSSVALSVLIVSLGFSNYQAYAAAKKFRSEKLLISGLIYSVVVFFPLSALAGFTFLVLGFFDSSYIFIFIVASTCSIAFQSGLGYVQGKGNMKYYNIFSLVSPLILFVFAIFLYFFKKTEVIFWGFALSEFLAAFFVVGWCIYSLKRPLIKFTTKLAILYLRESISYGVKSQIIVVITYLMYRGIILMMASKYSPASVGVLGFSLSLVEKSWIFSQVASIVLFKDMASKDFTIDKLKKSIALMFFLSLFGILFLGIIFSFFGEYMGPGYSDVLKYFLILSPGVAAFSGARICVNYLLLRGVNAFDVMIFLILLLITFVIAFFLILNYQITGGALAISLGYVLYFITVYKLIEVKNVTR